MVASLSKAMSQGALERYHSQDNYYSQGEELNHSQWQGQFAEHQNLTGLITAEDWKHACHGQDPQGNELRRKQINSRAGWDITLSACKSASLKALVDKDQTVLEAHRIAVIQTVQYIEQNCIYAQVKQSGQLKREQTQKGQFALFEHDDNRKQEPQLHTHVVVLNQTLCQDGKTRTLDSRELFIQKKTIGAYYDHAFAHQLQQKGFEIEWTSDHTFEIKGYQKEQLEAFSGRRQQIREHLEKQNIQLERASAAQKSIACLESRPLKIHKLRPIDHDQQRERWKKESDDLGIIHPQPHLNLERQYDLNSHPGSLSQVIQHGIESATAYQVATSRQVLLRECLRQAQAYYSPVAIEQTLDQHAELIPTQDGRLTTTRSLQREQFILQTANHGKGTQPPLVTVAQVNEIAQQKGLNEGQQNGLNHIATSTDLITLLQGNAGVGKTYTMSAFRDCLMEKSDRLQGLAPSAAAAETLATEAGISATTVDRYLLSSQETTGQILLVDEAGMVSSQQMERLIRKAQEQHSRLILVGDTKQLSAVEAGAPFRLLQSRSQLKTVTIEQNLRQRVPHLFDAVGLAAQHRTNEALIRLDHYDCIQEIPNPTHRNQTVVAQYLARDSREQAQTLILCDTNQDRRNITHQIRDAYIAIDILGQDTRTLQILYSKQLDKQAIAQVYNYAVGDMIQFHRPSKHFPDSYYRVAEVKDNTLILKDRSGQTQEMAIARFKERQVFESQPLEIRVGDRLRFTRNHRDWHQTNGQPYTIEALNQNGSIEIRTKGQRYTVTPDQLLHSDYAYCRTVYSAQGWTSAEAIWAPSQHPGREQTYVALTRAKETLQIITLDREALGLSVQQSQAQENAIELIQPDLTSPAFQATTPQQLTLFSGQDDEPQRPPTRSISRKRPSPPQKPTGSAPRQHRSPSKPDQQTAQPPAKAKPTRAADEHPPVSPAPPARRGLADFTEAFGKLAADLETSGRSTRADTRTAPESAPNAGELDHEHESIQPDPANLAEPTTGISSADQPSERPATALRDLDETRLEPSPEPDTEPCESFEPDPSEVERDRVEHEVDSDRVSSNDLERQPAEFGVDSDQPEREIHAPFGADERTVEQFGDSDQKTVQTSQLEAKASHLESALEWSDTELLEIERQVQNYFKQPPPEPDWERGQQLKDQVSRLVAQQEQRARITQDHQAEVNRLGVARSWLYPFGSPGKEVDAAKAQLESSQSRLVQGRRQLEQAQAQFEQWRKPGQIYEAWRWSDRGEQLHEFRQVLSLEPVQDRLTRLHRAQKMQQDLEWLGKWQEAAISLNRPEPYIQRIRELTVAYQGGEPLPEAAHQALVQDIDAHRELQQRSQQRPRGFSL